MSSWTPHEPYNDLPPRPRPVQPPSTLLLEAASALGRADEAARSIPNPGVLAAVVPILEAQASSAIENIVTTSDELLREAAGVGTPTPATTEALRARSALIVGVDALRARPVSPAVATLVADELMGHSMQFRRGGGVYIGRPDGTRVYTPPEGHERIASLLDEWATYVHDASVDPLTRMALSHYQFEAIHPFHDGNGRTGRILNQLLLIESGLIEQPVLYLSGMINHRRRDYYERLLAVTAEDAWEPWLEFMLLAVRDGSHWSLERAVRVRAAFTTAAEEIDRVLPNGVSTKFVDVLFRNAYVTIRDVVEACGVTRQTASNWLHRLSDSGLMTELPSGRTKAFVNRPFLAALVQD
ncbi:Fic/DOC family N-terminal domain-containing protein [Agrococcus sp. SCSIO52902]|uniref:Fic family protein n=1 Tax=Agrococcus sp. SCSIO52902 TaxID=2933290 RepID=UPI001FF2D002|nr:Fic/DOC family N-terminal domain-containing protein [Agrococcus sp. SCSIO52902]UOW01881.1 Fic family protein [Agrococcus sp. SCSIO52902]